MALQKGTDTAAGRCLDWMQREKESISSSRYGRNLSDVEDAVREQRQKASAIRDYRREITRAIRGIKDDAETQKLERFYEELKALSLKKLECLESMLQIACMEQNCGSLSAEYDAKAVELVTSHKKDFVSEDESANSNHLPGFVSAQAQDCVFGVQDNWEWQLRMVRCLETHLKHAAAYHQFFHEVEETENYLEDDLEHLHVDFESTPLSGGDEDCKRLLEELDALLLSLRQWETKTNVIWAKAEKVMPVNRRTETVMSPLPARCICDYETNKIRIREDEDLQLIDNSKGTSWKVSI